MTARFWFAEKKNVSLMNKFDFKCEWKKTLMKYIKVGELFDF